ncbi:MAG TPA: cytochrome-c oxidase, cbb3-type subunit II, partial [Bdellovibrionales bacterium]|nr:cytochrome-c oxidase, cbb3-type subunit II [Bdellovibrionales bacterium]
WVRAIGGTMFLAGFIIMIVNVWKTIANAPASAPDRVAAAKIAASHGHETRHRKLEGATVAFTVLTVLAILVGSVIEIVPTLMAHTYVAANNRAVPYTPLELAGRDVYVREGCYTCHSQMIRPMVSEKLRYGDPSTLEDSMYDRPFQWGSKRTGPDLARVGGKYPDLWHLRHMDDPREVVAGSIMPAYSWLLKNKTDFASLSKKFAVMQSLGVPYNDLQVQFAGEEAMHQAEKIAAGLEEQGAPKKLADKEIVALIAYLQRLGNAPNAATQKQAGGGQ